MGTYIRKLQDRRKQVPARDMPTGKSKALRAAFENLERGTEETTVDRAGYLEALGEISWPAIMGWPELCYYTSSLGQYSQFPTQAHHDAVLYAMGYLFSDPDRGITYGGPLKIPFGLQEFPPQPSVPSPSRASPCGSPPRGSSSSNERKNSAL
jgi:hypothetical protein